MVCVFDGKGKEYLVRLTKTGKHTAYGRIIDNLEPIPESPLRLILAQAVLKATKMEMIIQRCVELGISELIPVITDNSQVPSGRGFKEAKGRRWERIIIEATRQCGRATIPRLRKAISWEHFLEESQSIELKLIATATAGQSLNEALTRMQAPNSCLVAIGPEGDFSASEIAAAFKNGFEAVNLGSRILRAETAAITLTAILQNRFGDLG